MKRRKVAKKSAAPKRRVKRRKTRAKKTTLKANRKRRTRRLRRNYGTSAGAKKGWRTRKAKARKSSKRSSVAPKKRRVKRRKSRKASAVAPKRKRRKSKRKSKLTANRKRRTSRRRLSTNRKRRSSRRRLSTNRKRLSPNKRRRSSRRRLSTNRRRRSHRRNGRSMFRKNGILEPVMFIAKTGGLALAGLLVHKVITNVLTTQVFNRIFGAPATVVATPTSALVTAPATAGLGGLSVAPEYQKLGASFLVAGLGVFASVKLIKNPATRNTVMTGFALSFVHTAFMSLLSKFAPQYAGMLAGPEDGTAARLSAMYGFGDATSIQPRYAAINGMGEYFTGTAGLGEYFTGTSGLGLPSYEAAAGMGEYFTGTSGLGSYGGNPDLAEAAAGMGARETMNTDHVDPNGDLDRELTIAEAAAGVGNLPSYEAAAGFGAVQSLPSSSTWIPGTSNGQIWAGTRSISNAQSSTEMVPAGVLQTSGGQGVFG